MGLFCNMYENEKKLHVNRPLNWVLITTRVLLQTLQVKAYQALLFYDAITPIIRLYGDILATLLSFLCLSVTTSYVRDACYVTLAA